MDGFRNPTPAPTPSKVVEYKGLSFKRIIILKMKNSTPYWVENMDDIGPQK